MKNNFFGLNTLLIVALFFSACSNDDLFLDQEEVGQDFSAIPECTVLVSSKQAIEVANAFFGINADRLGLKSSGSAQRANASVEAIRDQDGDPLMYIVNYPEGGWAIVSATRSYYPILAYNDENAFVMRAPHEMGGVNV